jgi:hypothetical protein
MKVTEQREQNLNMPTIYMLVHPLTFMWRHNLKGNLKFAFSFWNQSEIRNVGFVCRGTGGKVFL